jgi:HK97 family phage major capsid protein
MTLEQLQSRRNELAAEIETQRSAMDARVQAGEAPFNEEQQARWDTTNGEFDDVCRQMTHLRTAQDVRQRAEEVAEAQRRSQYDRGRTDREQRVATGADDDHHTLAMGAWFRRQSGHSVTEQERDAAGRCGINLESPNLDIDLFPQRDFRALRHALRIDGSLEQRILSGGSSTAGATLRPEGFVQNLELAMLHFGPMLQVADIMQTADGNDTPWPTGNDTTNVGELLANDNTAVGTADPTFGNVIYKAYPYSSKLVRVPVALLQDSAFDLALVLGEMLGERIGRILNNHTTLGDGVDKPQGIVNGSTQGKASASASAIADTELIDLEHSVDIAYRRGAAFLMHDNVAAYIRKLKDGNERFLWSAGDGGLSSGPGGLLLNRPLWINNDMDDTLAGGARSILFGQLNKYKIRRVRGVRLRRLVERYAEFDQEGFVAFLRFDGRMLNAGGNPVKHLVQGAATTTTTAG